MVQYNPLQLPLVELPDSDDTPMSNELQILIPKEQRLREELIPRLRARGLDLDDL